jgi:hypothetical protein
MPGLGARSVPVHRTATIDFDLDSMVGTADTGIAEAMIGRGIELASGSITRTREVRTRKSLPRLPMKVNRPWWSSPLAVVLRPPGRPLRIDPPGVDSAEKIEEIAGVCGIRAVALVRGSAMRGVPGWGRQRDVAGRGASPVRDGRGLARSVASVHGL